LNALRGVERMGVPVQPARGSLLGSFVQQTSECYGRASPIEVSTPLRSGLPGFADDYVQDAYLNALRGVERMGVPVQPARGSLLGSFAQQMPERYSMASPIEVSALQSGAADEFFPDEYVSYNVGGAGHTHVPVRYAPGPELGNAFSQGMPELGHVLQQAPALVSRPDASEVPTTVLAGWRSTSARSMLGATPDWAPTTTEQSSSTLDEPICGVCSGAEGQAGGSELICDNPGSIGHPELCNRMCSFVALNGECVNGKDCNFCHCQHHERVRHLKRKNRQMLKALTFEQRVDVALPIIRKRIVRMGLAAQAAEFLEAMESAAPPTRARSGVDRTDRASLSVALSALRLRSIVVAVCSGEERPGKLGRETLEAFRARCRTSTTIGSEQTH